MSRAWLLGVAAAAVVVGALLARVDPSPPPVDEPTPEPGDAEPGPRPTGDAEPPQWAPVGAWQPMAASPIGPRSDHVGVWTGLCPAGASPRSCGELLVWGGHDGRRERADGAAYDLVTNSWRTLPPAPRSALGWEPVPGVWTGVRPDASHVAHGAGGELVVWGATAADVGAARDGEPRGAAYDPVADRWRVLAEAPIAPRVGHNLTWTGEEVIVWGGRRPDGGELLDDGAAYDPAADRWRALPPAPMSAREGHAAVWLAGRLALLGGRAGSATEPAPAHDGAVYHPAADAWQAIPEAPAAGQPWTAATRDPQRPAGVLTLAPVRGDDGEWLLATYDLDRAVWDTRPAGPIGARPDALVATDGERIVVWGGATQEAAAPGVLRYPRTGAWRLAPDERDPAPGESATWTGRALLTWGGGREGASWDPTAGAGAAPGAQGPQDRRTAALPAGHETSWPLRGVPTGEPFALRVAGSGARQVDLRVAARWGWSERARTFEPTDSTCDAEACTHRFAPLPDVLPGRLHIHLRAGEQPVAVEIAVEG